MSAPRRPLLARKRIFWRIFSISLLFFLLVAFAGALLTFLLDSHTAWYRLPRFIGNAYAAELAGLLDRPEQLQAALDRIADDSQLALTIYRRDGRLVAHAHNGLLPALAPAEAVALQAPKIKRSGLMFLHAVPLPVAAGESAYLLVGIPAGMHLHRALGLLAILCILVLLLSALLGWDISRPLRQLKKQADAYGAGELSARTAIRRSDEIGDLAATLNDMGARIEATVRREKEMLANISHEIRTPLARIRVALELCAEEESRIDTIKRHLQGIDTDLAELDALVNDALITFRLEVAKSSDRPAFQPRLEPLDPGSLIEEAVTQFRQNHAAEIRVTIEKPLPPVAGDAELLRRVVDNLLDNALKYGEPTAAIEISVRSAGREVTVEIADRGRGVPAAALPHLFEPFFRVEDEVERKVMGMGLGLTLCQRIVEAHGGRIEAARRDGGGLIIRFHLPIKS